MKRIYKISIYIVSAIIIILVVFNLLFSSVLKWQVRNLSNGEIHLRSEKASANIFSESILFTDVLIEFDSMSVDAASKIYLRNLKFSSLEISHISIFQLLFKRNFSVGKIEFSDPELNFMRDTVISSQDLFTKVITPEVVKSKSQGVPFSFEIEEIVINQGVMYFRGREGEEVDLEKINIRIQDVRLSDLSQMEVTKKDLSAQFTLNVNLYNVRKRFKDIYTFSIDSFSYYSGIKHLLLSGISLTPDSLVNFEDQPEINFTTEFLKINGFDLNEFIMNQNLEFEKVQISNGNFWESKESCFLNNEDELDTAKKSSAFGIGFLNSFQTDTFQLQNLNLLSLTKKSDTVYRVENGNITILDINVDSGFMAEYKYLDLAENTNLYSGSLRIQWMKPVFDFRCDTFSFTGDDGREFMKNIRFTHHTYSRDRGKQQLLIDAGIDSLEMKGLNIRKLLLSDSIHLSMFLQNPKVSVFERDSLPVKSKKRKKGKFPSTIYFDDFRIQDGAFSFVSEVSTIDAKLDELNLIFDTLKINLQRKGDLDFVDFNAFKLECKEILYKNSQNPGIGRIGSLFLNENNFNISNIQFSDAIRSRPSFGNSFEMEKFSINGFDLKNLVNKKEFICGEVLIQKPEYFGKRPGNKTRENEKLVLTEELIAKEIAEVLNGKINKLQIGNIKIEEGVVDFEIALDSIHVGTYVDMELQNIYFDPKNLIGDTLFHLPEYFQFGLHNTALKSSKFEFDLDAISYNNSDEELRIVNLLGETPDGSSTDPKFRIEIPLIRLKSPNWNPENKQAFRFASVGIDSPDLYFELDEKEKAPSSKPKKKFALPFFVSDSVKVSFGTFKMQINKQDDTLDILADNFNLEWKAITTEYLASEFSDDLLAGINFDVRDFTLNSEKSNISLDNIYFDKQKNIIELEGIKQLAWKPTTDRTERKLKNRISIPNLQLKYPHLYGEIGEPLGLWVSNITGNETDLEFYPMGGENKKAPHFKISDSSAVNFLETFKYLRIDSTYFPNIHIRVNTNSTKQKPIDFKRISFHMNGLLMDSSMLDPEKEAYAEDVFIHLHDREIYSADSMYKFRTSHLTYYLSKDQIVFDSLEVLPQFEKDEFFERAHYQTDRMQVSTKNIIIDGIDLESLIKSGEYHFDKITVNKLKLLDHRDQHYPRKEGQFRPLPQEMLENVPAFFKVDTVQVNDSYILYGEYVDKSNFPGEVYFDDFNASIYNVTNVFKKLDTSFMMTTYLQSKLMGSADLDLTLKVPLIENADYFWFSGDVTNIDLTDFNSMTENLFGITIRRGHGSLKIPLITANNTKSIGEITFLYKKFKLSMYNRKKARMNRGIASPLMDFMMNDVLVKSNNPKFLRKVRVGEVYFVRDQEKSIFNYLWKSTMSGTLSTMGFNKKEQRQAAKEKKKEMKEEKEKKR